MNNTIDQEGTRVSMRCKKRIIRNLKACIFFNIMILIVIAMLFVFLVYVCKILEENLKQIDAKQNQIILLLSTETAQQLHISNKPKRLKLEKEKTYLIEIEKDK